jgi:hypothetical protein
MFVAPDLLPLCPFHTSRPAPCPTQESFAFHGGPISTCQSPKLPISSQLEGGCRFLDYRFSLKDGVLLGYHGIQNEYVTAQAAFDSVYTFLEAHPRECVIVSVKQVRAKSGESGERQANGSFPPQENSAPLFEETVWKLLNQRRDLWYTEDRWPTLGEVRGKAVMFCRFGFSTERASLPVPQTSLSQSFA